MVTSDVSKFLITEGMDGGSVNRMLEHYKRLRFYFGCGKYEETGLHVGKFCENVGNLILEILGGDIETSPSLGSILTKIKSRDNDSTIDGMIRTVIPRFLRAAYDLRSKRDAVHTNLVLSVNHVDASVAVHICNWILAEFVRVYGGAQDISQAKKIIENFAQQVSPFVDEYKGKRWIMSNKLTVSQEVLVHLNNVPGGVLEVNILVTWIPNADNNHIRTVLRQLQEKRRIFYSGNTCKITPLGSNYIEDIVKKLTFK